MNEAFGAMKMFCILIGGVGSSGIYICQNSLKYTIKMSPFYCMKIQFNKEDLKTILRYTSPIRLTKFQKSDSKFCWQNCGEKSLLTVYISTTLTEGDWPN